MGIEFPSSVKCDKCAARTTFRVVITKLKPNVEMHVKMTQGWTSTSLPESGELRHVSVLQPDACEHDAAAARAARGDQRSRTGRRSRYGPHHARQRSAFEEVTLVVKQTPRMGCGVFTEEDLSSDVLVLRFRGPLRSLAQLDPEGNHDLQVGPDLYIGASHDIDDFVNHSCAPNCRVDVESHGARLITIRPIYSGEEITFDYSTTSTEDERTWSMRCLCGAPGCRRTISGFRTLPKAARARCIAARMVPRYVLEALEEEAASVP